MLLNSVEGVPAGTILRAAWLHSLTRLTKCFTTSNPWLRDTIPGIPTPALQETLCNTDPSILLDTLYPLLILWYSNGDPMNLGLTDPFLLNVGNNTYSDLYPVSANTPHSSSLAFESAYTFSNQGAAPVHVGFNRSQPPFEAPPLTSGLQTPGPYPLQAPGGLHNTFLTEHTLSDYHTPGNVAPEPQPFAESWLPSLGQVSGPPENMFLEPSNVAFGHAEGHQPEALPPWMLLGDDGTSEPGDSLSNLFAAPDPGNVVHPLYQPPQGISTLDGSFEMP